MIKRVQLLDTDRIIEKMYLDIFEINGCFDDKHALAKYSILMGSLTKAQNNKASFGLGCLAGGVLAGAVGTTTIPIALGYTFAVYGFITAFKGYQKKSRCRFFFNSLIDILIKVHKLSDKEVSSLLKSISLEEVIEFLEIKQLVKETSVNE